METSKKRQRGRPRSFNGPSEAASVQSLDRALRILAIVAEGSGLSLSEISAQSGLAASTAYRMLTTLENHGMVEFDGTDQLWSIGVETYRMGAAFLRRRKLVDRARIVMQELMEKTGETANLGVAEDDCVVFVSQVETHQAIRAFFRPGTRSSFHASGIGKAVLAHLDPERVAAILRRAGLERFTDKTISDISALARDLVAIKHRGWSVDDEERHPGMRCVAAAIFNEFGEPIGGVSVSGPTVRVTPERLADIGPLVREAATDITRMIGGHSSQGAAEASLFEVSATRLP
ncbi:MAG: IclR family transcriptional regulator [Mesorhizobium sp.]|uniref:HTH-type transcriptional regulator BhcR n=4 Tax=unclassified Mesorhizobium TaxID=325217 RepID=UPI000FD2DAC6|nr:HTH-type transcriptional regulator BhcR [Mesorhizobium sp.]RVD74191.1 IclR family transcriptional regulator [Mesorhizobium sp. M4A.F.Ca.ET.029.04.2.1]TIW34105.1 MAG: IclR family transcriptional regulator [Mesorhizobium sp.]